LIKNINLVQGRFASLQHKAMTALALAVVRVRLNDEAGGRELLDQIRTLDPDQEVQQKTAAVRKYLDDRHQAER
jgi:hypothetical protein